MNMMEKKMKRTKRMMKIKKEKKGEYKREGARWIRIVFWKVFQELEEKKERSETHSEECNSKSIWI